ncbi:MAG: cation-transporting P-type ATPase [Candidatus Pacearchaeota archaeon]|nr:cation-transporting P-type ATPase [Candidatus Pacearchaeota archaeon]
MDVKKRFKGLTEEEAKKKLEKYGYNEIKEIIKISPLQILFRQVKKNFVIYLLFVAMLISFFVGKGVTGYVILCVIFIVVFTGFIQEYRAEKAIKALKKILIPISIVIRNGKEIEVPSREIVPGDIIILRTGERVPADCIVLEEKELALDESILTGESSEVKKSATKSLKSYRRENTIFMGTFITRGKCVAQAIHTGMNTEFGKIASMISTAEKELTLQKKVNHIAKYMAIVAVIVSILTGFVMIARNLPFSYTLLIEVLIVVIALSVSAFPEGFPVVLTTTLASGAYRMAKKNAIVHRMSTIETLGETTVICSDKTGTITTGEMTVKKVFCDDLLFDISGAGYSASGEFLYNNRKIGRMSQTLQLLLKTAVLCNDAIIERKGTDREYSFIGTPTETALLIMAAKAGVFKEDLDYERLEEIPFSSERKMMSVLCKENSKNYVYSKGATEILLEKCSYVQKNNEVIRIGEKEKRHILAINKKLTLNGFRTLALAYKKANSTNKNSFEEDLVFLGIAAIEDPPREEVKSALELCKTAGIKVKMITGDDKETAITIAKQIDMPCSRDKVITGQEIDKLTDDELSKIVNQIVIFARVRPEHKLRIVKALKQNNEVVTMTGDGVNDAPALKEAHIGIAMGKKGTDVSREAADLTLKDDNFSTIVSAIIEGRTVFNNVRKFTTYQLSCNYAELAIIFVGILIGLPLPLLALQILFMNLVTDDLPAITLGFNPPSHDVMKTPPRKKSQIINKQLFILLSVAGIIMAAGTLGVFYYALKVLDKDIVTARTSALITLIFFEIANAFNFRSFRYGVHKLPLFANKYLVYASLVSILATIAIIYIPSLSNIFETAPIDLYHWLFAFVISLSVIIVFDILKIINQKKPFITNHL